MSERVSELRDLKGLLWESIREVEADRRSPLAAQLRAVMAELAELEGPAGDVAVKGPADAEDELLSFRLRKRAN